MNLRDFGDNTTTTMSYYYQNAPNFVTSGPYENPQYAADYNGYYYQGAPYSDPTQGMYYQQPPPFQPHYHHGNPGRGRGRGNFRQRGRGRGHVDPYMMGQGPGYYGDHVGYLPSTGDPNLDDEYQYVARSESYSHRGNARSRGRGKNRNGQSTGNKSASEQTIFDSEKVSSSENKDDQAVAFHSKKAQGRGKGARLGQNGSHGDNNPQDAESQRDLLIEQLGNNTYECMVCCDIVRRDAAIWNCDKCFHVFHLRCIKKWAKSSSAVKQEDSSGWRCPACQKVNEQFPGQYRCYCGKVRDPQTVGYEIPHGCGEVCKKKRPHNCTHPCNILCHPGPCPPCLASITKHCDCGNTKQTVKCGQATSLKCTSVCQKTLNCGRHECTQVCHGPPCQPCEDMIKQTCYCGKVERSVLCGTTEAFNKSFSCKQTCGSSLECGSHVCETLCHPGACEGCHLLPTAVTHCPCGKTSLADLQTDGQARTKCTDPIPTCDNVCSKPLKCGPKDEPHRCERPCHEGPCGACSGMTEQTCRCGRFTTELACQDVAKFTDEEPFTCDRRCNKKRKCGKHKCGQLCCVDTEHVCDQVCGRKLSCGLHRCEEPCHRNNCPTCWHVSFEELRCHCGLEVIFPPIPCGTKAPECRQPCTRKHACGHTARHNCHIEERCPPCTELTQKWCMGRHERRKNIPCHLTDISCGLPCGKDLSCRLHKCTLVCHKGLCPEECTQPCPRPREDCDHPCGAPCHGDSPCPPTPCRAEVVIKCDCGNRSERAQCMLGGEDKAGDFVRTDAAMMAMTLSNTMDGQGVDLSSMMKDASKKRQRKLECTQACSLLERNKRLALALEIKNPDVSSKLGNPTYNQFLRDYAKQYTTFVASVEENLSELVKTAEQSKQLKRSHAFKAMNSNQRRVVHELAEFYGCETQSYDEPPNKNVVATAYRGKCYHPSVTLTKHVQRELHPKAPTPIPHHGKEHDIRSSVEAANKSTSVLGAWGKLRPTAPSQAMPPTKPAPWASSTANQSAARRPESTAPSSALKLKSMSVLGKESGDKKSGKNKTGRNSPQSSGIDYYDIDYFDVTD